MTAQQALAFVKRRGVVLVSARGPVPSLVEAIAGEKVRGSWWGHRRGRHIYAVLGTVGESPDVLCCRLVEGKLTFVHRRVWPALVRLAPAFPRESLASLTQVHMPSGEHRVRRVPYPRWVPPEVRQAARALTPEAARADLGAWAEAPRTGGATARRSHRRRRAARPRDRRS